MKKKYEKTSKVTNEIIYECLFRSATFTFDFCVDMTTINTYLGCRYKVKNDFFLKCACDKNYLNVSIHLYL